MKAPQHIAVLLPPRTNSASTNIGGKAFRTTPKPRHFPHARRARRGPFPLPANKPAAGDFNGWVEYFTQFVGSQLAKLNALQFDMTKNNSARKAQDISNELGVLADELNVGGRNTTNVAQLRWPLAGLYSLEQDVQTKGFRDMILDLYFENEPDSRLVANCTIEISATGSGSSITLPISSSSSYIAPSSSR